MRKTFFLLLFVFSTGIISQNIQKFEHFNSQDGLSQNTVFSIHCDRKGFLWIGTWNGLNRFDGHQFKLFKNPLNSTSGLFTNNRIINIWEDKKEMIWMQTYDHFYHFLNPQTETTETYPTYNANSNNEKSVGSSFLQYSDSIIMIGSTNSGIHILKYNKTKNIYQSTSFDTKTQKSISDNYIKLIHADHNKNIWILTDRGLNHITAENINQNKYIFQHIFLNVSFSNTVAENNDEIWFGTNSHGILVYNKNTQKYSFINPVSENKHLPGAVNHIVFINDNSFLTSFEDKGLYLYNNDDKKWTKIIFHGKSAESIYIDKFKQAWITAKEFGLTRLDIKTLKTNYYKLTPIESDYITDLERPYFFEDSKHQLWIGLHGSGLAFYNRKNDKFHFFRNNPKDQTSIGSNIVHCINEDKSGQLWLGTGQYKGGLEKVVFNNPAITHKITENEYTNLFTNVVRAMEEDKNGNIWIASKSGKIYIYNSNLELIHIQKLYSKSIKTYSGNNVYSIYQSKNGYIWLGSKGEGIGRSTEKINTNTNYSNITFKWYKNDPENPTSISSNNVYSITEDEDNNLWIGTFGNGINLINSKNIEYPKFEIFNTSNSNISSNSIRHLHIDSHQNLWAATVFGVNFLHHDSIRTKSFTSILHNKNNPNSISYNDVIHIYEDSKQRLWFSTMGGGVNVLEDFSSPTAANFKTITMNDGLSNDVVFGVLEDTDGKLWFSSEHGLSRYSPKEANFAVYTENNGLSFNNFSENTCLKTSKNQLLFGGNLGFISINSDKLKTTEIHCNIELTSFLLFNEAVTPNSEASPLKKAISYSDSITLRPTQSSFSIEFSTLDYLDPGNIQYAYKLTNFDKDWNYIGNQNKATYTKLPPGKYTFMVKSTNRNGLWNENDIRTLQITLLPPWYRSNYAYIGITVLLLIIIFTAQNIKSKLDKYRQDLQLEKKINLVKLQFFTNVSHEIRTPLTLIIGPIEDLLMNNDINESVKNKLKLIQRNTKRMLRLTNQLLDFRKVQNNKMQLKVKEIDIVSFAHDIFKSFEPLANHKGIIYTFEKTIDALSVWVDPSQLDIIIYNLLSNALKFTDLGKNVTLKISQNNQLNNVEISVIDEGKGIPSNSLNEIFTRYTILSDHELSGTGIGLSLSYELAKLHGGEIKVKSEINKGSTFTLVLQLGKKHLKKNKNIKIIDSNSIESEYNTSYTSDNEIIEITPNANAINEIPELKALIVEDNSEILDYIEQALRPDFQCILAQNGEEALRLLEDNNPDIIITDIMMPVMDGIELTKQLKSKFETCHIPIIMLTAKTDFEDQIDGIETGAEAYIKKPFNTTHLKTVATNLIKQRKKIIDHYQSSGYQINPNTLKINSKDEDFLKKLVNYVEENHSKEITIDQLAEYCCLSRTVFYNKIKGLTGSSPIEFLRELKLKIAAQLLEKGFNVSEVAFQVGFNDVKYFSRQFKSLFGHSPSKHVQTKNNESK
ncbi:MAG: response regulator [Marinilabiliaceae bacterium]|nr:response regulator [Marinilabiliaceae bacterium]